MTGRLLSMLGRRSRLARGLTVAAVGLLALSVVASALTSARGPKHRTAPQSTRRTERVQTPRSPRRPPWLSAGELARARETAERFLSGYLPLLYGRGSARSVDAVTRGLRLQLMHARAEVTPAEHRRQPRVVSLGVVPQSPRVALTTALIEDGGVTAYALRITLREDRSRWLASAVDGG